MQDEDKVLLEVVGAGGGGGDGQNAHVHFLVALASLLGSLRQCICMAHMPAAKLVSTHHQ